MKAHSGRKRIQPRAASSKQAPPQIGRSLPMHIRRYVAFTIIGLSVIGGFLLTPLPVAIALTVLAIVRIAIWRREERREEQASLVSETACNLR